MEIQELQVVGALLQGYTQACLNLNIIAGSRATERLAAISMNDWYPLARWVELEKTVLQSYKNAAPILLRVGIEMMSAWYKYGPGSKLISHGSDFLHFQTGSQGYVSVVRGSREQVGAFELDYINHQQGLARIHSTTPFNRNMECGVLIGGMMAPGDLDYVDVVNDREADYLEIEFH
jgi:hypothetical protein